MGIILKARDRVIGRELAMKVPVGGPGWDDVAEGRFLREARITGQLQHPGIVPVYDVGRFADGRPYMAMRLVRGRPLDEILAVGGVTFARQPVKWVRVFEQVCRPVAYAHGKGVIHRDLKPHNVVLAADGHVWVLDWGLAKVLSEADDPVRAAARAEPAMDPGPGKTDHGTTLGTPGYMAPEQARGEPGLDERADVFALGAVLCQVLTGLPPFAHPDPHEVWRKNRAGDVADALARLDGCGPCLGLTALATRCLAPSPRNRLRDAQEVLEEMGEVWAGLADRPRAE
jgi:serine/threonine-protein kinase